MQTEKGLVASDPAPGASATVANLSRLSILVVESDAELRRTTSELLVQLGVHDVLGAESAEAALSALRARAFDVLLAAEQLEGSAGVELIRTAKQVSPATRSVLVRGGASSGEPREVDPGSPPSSSRSPRAATAAGIEAIARPLSAEDLQRLLQSTATPRGGLWCEVPQLSLTDILQMYHQGRRSITVLLSGPIAGRIRLQDGEIVDAQSESLRGLPALSRLLEADSGLLRTESSDDAEEQTITGPFQLVVMESVQWLDERRRDSKLGIVAEQTQTIATQKFSIQVREPTEDYVPTPDPFAASLPARPAVNWALWVVSLLGVVALVFGARLYWVRHAELASPAQTQRLGLSAEEPASATPPAAVDAPTAPAPAAPASFAPGQGQAAQPQHGEAAAAAAEPGAAESRGTEPTDSPVSSFVLNIISKPSRAAVTERGKFLGRTPLRLKLDNASVTETPREFLLYLPGYRSHRFSQAGSNVDVKTVVVLAPRPSVIDSLTGEPGEDQAPGNDRQPQKPGTPRSDLGIRLRR
jgi:CheY-like chemotaxis protein